MPGGLVSLGFRVRAGVGVWVERVRTGDQKPPPQAARNPFPPPSLI